MEEGHTNESGVAAIEVALLIGLVAIVVMGTIKVLGSHSSNKLNTAATSIHSASGGSGGGGAPIYGDPGGGTGGDLGGTATTTSTTIWNPIVTTTEPPTTTTVPPTSTTTTLPPPPTSASSEVYPVTTELVGSSDWQASTSVAILGNDGSLMPNATVTISVGTYKQRRPGKYRWYYDTMTVTTDDTGTAHIDVGPYGLSGNGSVSVVSISVTDVTMDPPTVWDGNSASSSATSP